LKLGQPAPDVSLVSLDGKTRVRLVDSTGGKPLVLVFGSYT
jgi:peroxiredoxin